MKFTIDTKILSDALRIAAVATMGGRTTLPILGNIKIEAEKDQIILSTTNLEIYVRQKLAAKVKKEGATTAPFQILSQLVSEMQGSETTLSQQDGVIEFKSGKATAELETLDAKEFPEPLPTSGDGVDCTAMDIIRPFQMLSHAISTETSRYALQGININDKGEFVATDGRRIALFTGVKLTNENIIIPDAFIRAILKIDPDGAIKVFAGNGTIAVVNEKIDICAKLIEAKFPDGPREVMQKFKADKALSCNRKELLRALRFCSIGALRPGSGLYISGKGKEVEVSQPGKSVVPVLGSELGGQPEVSIKLNEIFLIGALEVLDGEDCRIRVSDGVPRMMVEEGKHKELINPMVTPETKKP